MIFEECSDIDSFYDVFSNVLNVAVDNLLPKVKRSSTKSGALSITPLKRTAPPKYLTNVESIIAERERFDADDFELNLTQSTNRSCGTSEDETIAPSSRQFAIFNKAFNAADQVVQLKTSNYQVFDDFPGLQIFICDENDDVDEFDHCPLSTRRDDIILPGDSGDCISLMANAVRLWGRFDVNVDILVPNFFNFAQHWKLEAADRFALYSNDLSLWRAVSMFLYEARNLSMNHIEPEHKLLLANFVLALCLEEQFMTDVDLVEQGELVLSKILYSFGLDQIKTYQFALRLADIACDYWLLRWGERNVYRICELIRESDRYHDVFISVMTCRLLTCFLSDPVEVQFKAPFGIVEYQDFVNLINELPIVLWVEDESIDRIFTVSQFINFAMTASSLQIWGHCSPNLVELLEALDSIVKKMRPCGREHDINRIGQLIKLMKSELLSGQKSFINEIDDVGGRRERAAIQSNEFGFHLLDDDFM